MRAVESLRLRRSDAAQSSPPSVGRESLGDFHDQGLDRLPTTVTVLLPDFATYSATYETLD
jgi:hypothetical protein